MNFNSLEFLLFAPAVIIIHWLLPHKLRKYWLLAASYFFYMCWNPVLILLIIFSAAVDYSCSLGMERFRESSGIRKLLLMTSIFVNLGLLFSFKYLDFFGSGFNSLWSLMGMDTRMPEFDLILPVGISFYTFQTMSYTIDVYRGRMKPERDPVMFALYVSFFPQLVAGPIERPGNLLPQLVRERKWEPENLPRGCFLMIRGFFKKLVVADTLAVLVDGAFAAPESATGPMVILGTILFGFQIYCDFSGYSDIARGTSNLLGIDLMENFHRPYSAISVRDFWKRWHISLTSWFTDYVYIPLGGSRKGLARHCLNLMVVFLLSGLWHGAEWTFVIWGAIHGLMQICEVLLDRTGVKKPHPLVGWACTFTLVSLSWLPFRAANLEELGILLGQLSTGWGSAPDWDFLRLGMILLCLTLAERMDYRKKVPTQTRALGYFYAVLAICVGWLTVLSGNGQNAFIYFQF
ncbi:MAG: MBOAT family protein [Oscillospiraceae bacterium]|nr:MBOAT family protein [Oscillospiraceae bacterium]